MKRSIVAAAILSVLACGVGKVEAQGEITLRMLNAWDDRFPATVFVSHKFVEYLKQETKGRITVKGSGPEVVSPREQFQPVSSGAFDLNFSASPYYVGTTGLPFVFFALPPDSELWRKFGYWDDTDKEFQRFNLKLVAMVSGGTKDNAFQIFLREPIDKGDKPLAGRKIRGNIFYRPLVIPLGGSLVNMDPGETYTALQTGVIDGAGWPMLGATDSKLQEVAKYMLRPRFGLAPYTLTMNLESFRKLSKEDQELILNVGRRVEQEAPKLFDAEYEKEVAKLEKMGIKETDLEPSVFKKVNEEFMKAVWDQAISSNSRTKAQTQALYDKAVKNGHASK